MKKEDPVLQRVRRQCLLLPETSEVSSLSALVVALVAAIASWSLHRITYRTGMAVKPELSALLGVVSWWVPIIAATAVVLIRGRGSIGARVLLKIASILICISPLFFPKFREDLGWEGFKARVKHDVQPHDLSQWLAGYIATNSSPLWARKRLGPAEMAVFCRGGMRSTPAWVEKSERAVMIAWGSDFQIWAVAYGKATDSATEWKDNLFFRQLSK